MRPTSLLLVLVTRKKEGTRANQKRRECAQIRGRVVARCFQRLLNLMVLAYPLHKALGAQKKVIDTL